MIARRYTGEEEVAVKRPLGVAVAAMIGGLALLPASGGAQDPGATTLSFFEPNGGGTFRIVDSPPRSPSRNPGNRRFRFSSGDQLTFTNPLLDRAGGTRVGTLYGNVTVVRGRTFANAVVIGQVVFVFTDRSQIVAQGVFSLADDAQVAIVGGSGRYAGARGSVVSVTTARGSQDTLTLLP